MKLSNEHMDNWTPPSRLVNGLHFIKLDCKDRSCFRFCTGKALTFGSKYENSKYILDFWAYMVQARSSASQQAFLSMQNDLRQAAIVDEEEAADEAPKKKARFRCRAARMDDAETVGKVVEVYIAHDGHDHTAKFLFGVKKTDPWVEALPANLDFIVGAMKSDFINNNFAPTRPRGPHFRLQVDDEQEDIAGEEDAGTDGEAGADEPDA